MKKIGNGNSKIRDVFVLVPVFNEAPIVEGVIRELLNYFENIIVVNDASTDYSSDILHSLDVILLEHSLNLGQGAALRTGFRYIRKFTEAQAVITFDADGQHSAQDAVKFAHSILTGKDMVIFGSRFLGSTSDAPGHKKWMLKLATLVTNMLTNLELTDTHNGLKAFKCSALQYFHFEIDGYAFESELIRKVRKHNLKFSEMPTHIKYTDYSKFKGQKLSNAFIIIEDIIKSWRKL